MTSDDWSGPPGLGLLRERMNRLFDEGLRREEGHFSEPPSDVYATPERLVVTIELPGVLRSAVEVEAHAGTLLVRGQRPSRRPGESHHLERTHGPFVCRFDLPADADAPSRTTRLERGILTIEIPRRA